jgi:hypothetical protein
MDADRKRISAAFWWGEAADEPLILDEIPARVDARPTLAAERAPGAQRSRRFSTTAPWPVLKFLLAVI